MSQNRYFNFGKPIAAGDLKAAFSGIAKKGVLSGGQLSAIAPNIVSIQPVWVMFPSGMILFEDSTINLQVAISSTNKNFTITYRHNDADITGGSAATLQIEAGFLDNEDPALANGVAIGYIKYSGTGNLQSSQLIPAPPMSLTGKVTSGDGDFKFPPFGDGFLLISQTPPAPVVNLVTADTATTASLLYTNGGGNLLITANSAGVGGNSIRVRFANNGPSYTPLNVVADDSLTFTVNLETDGSGNPTAANSVSALTTALNGNATFALIATAAASGTLAAVVAFFPNAVLVPATYQNLSGGLTNYGFATQMNNTSGNDVTHVLKWVFIGRTEPVLSVVIEFAQGFGSSITLSVIDSNGNFAVLATPENSTESSGLTRRVIRILDGDFTSGQQFYVQASVFTKNNQRTSITLLGTSSYNLPF